MVFIENIFLIGDLHGSFKPVRSFAERYINLKKIDNNVLICLGDFGGNFFFDYRDENFKEKLGKYNFTYFVIRGNHEERPSLCMERKPSKWHIENYFENKVYVENDYPYIKYALDFPSFYNIGGYETFIFPGAYSVDKFRRIQLNWSWFPAEQLTKEEMDLGLQMVESHKNKCDLILSHTCPIGYEPTDLFMSTIDQSMVDKTMERYLDFIEHGVDYKIWLWGHFHEFRDYSRLDGKAKIMLSAGNEVVELNQIMRNSIVERI